MVAMVDSESIENPWGVSVFGAASISAEPDVAKLRVAVRETRDTPKEAFDITRAQAARVREVLRGHGIPDGAVSASRVALKSTWSYSGNKRHFEGYESSAAFVITLRELETLELVLVDVVDAGANQVDGVDFDISTKPELRAQARVAAVAAAREKGALYADAAGVGLGRVLHIKDVDSDELERSYGGHGRGGETMGRAGDLTPGKISVSAGVVVGFALLSDGD